MCIHLFYTFLGDYISDQQEINIATFKENVLQWRKTGLSFCNSGRVGHVKKLKFERYLAATPDRFFKQIINFTQIRFGIK